MDSEVIISQKRFLMLMSFVRENRCKNMKEKEKQYIEFNRGEEITVHPSLST
jgi:hypothetical protein